MNTRFDVTDEEWKLIESPPRGLRGARRMVDRRVMNGIFYVLRAGCPWRDLPERYGPIRPAKTATTVGPSAAFGRRSPTGWWRTHATVCT